MATPSAELRSRRIYFALHWGTDRRDAWSRSAADGPVVAAADDAAALPLYGFTLPTEQHVIAEWDEARVRLYPPPAAKVEHQRKADRFVEVPPEALSGQSGRRYLLLERGDAVRLTERELSLWVTVGEQTRLSIDYSQATFWLVVLLAIGLVMPLAFLTSSPSTDLVDRLLEEGRRKYGYTPPPPVSPEMQRVLDGLRAAKADGGAVSFSARLS